MPQTSKEKLKKVKKIELTISKNLFVICTIITLIAMVMAITEFFTRGEFPPSGMSALYVGVLIIYSVHKEMLRWLGEKEGERQGEWFLYAWIGLTVALYIINFLTKEHFTHSPEGIHIESLRETTAIALEVSGVFILTRLSKIIKLISEKNKREKGRKLKI